MDFSLNQEQHAWQMKARKFAAEEIGPISLQCDRVADPRGTFDWEIVKKGSRLGFRTLAVPKEWGGHGADFVTQALVMAELARGDSAISKTFSQCWKWSHLIADSCTPDQRERFLRPFLADETCLLGFAGTEPNAGSDNRFPPDDDPKAGWKLKAERKGDEWVLNGEKCFIANANVGKLFFVTARTNPNATIAEGTTLFLVPIDTPGLRVGKVFNKSGWRFYQNAELIFENARVPHANLVGEVNGGNKTRGGKVSKFGDLEYAANALGVCEAAVDMAMRHARAPRGADATVENQAVQLKLSGMHMLTEALRSFVMRVAAESDGTAARHAMNNVLLMNFAAGAIQRVTALNMDIHGGAGVMMMSARAEKLARDAFIWTHIAGDSAQRMRAVRHLVKGIEAQESGHRKIAA
jgi:alkylation response protein AidB-like acyl-CoA dehydrogenase